MKHWQGLVNMLVLGATVIAALAGPLGVHAAAPAVQDSAPRAASADTMAGFLDMQRGALNGQVTVGRGTVALNARLTDAGPEGQLSMSVPTQFALDLRALNGDLDSAICGVFGTQEISARGGIGSGLRLEFRDAQADPTACALSSTTQDVLIMGPKIIAAQAATAANDAGTVPQGVLDFVRRLLILALVGGLLLIFAPGLSAPLTAAARRPPWSRLGLGLGLLIGVPVIGVLIFALGFAVGLWWLGLLVLMFFACLLAFSMALSGLVLGTWMRERIHQPRIPALVAFVVGLALITFLGLLPTVGPLVNVVALAYGAGALMMLPRSDQSARTPPAAAAPIDSTAQAEPAPITSAAEPLVPVADAAAAPAVGDDRGLYFLLDNFATSCFARLQPTLLAFLAPSSRPTPRRQLRPSSLAARFDDG